MAKLPKDINTAVHLIDHKEYLSKKPRGYLGMSSIGGECERKAWYGFRWVHLDGHHLARTERIFQVGHYYEGEMIEHLESIGVEFITRQEEFVSCHGHMKGHSDGKIIKLPEAPKAEHVFEAKTHNQKSFESVVKKGVEKSKPVHYAQMQEYMKHSGCKRAYYLAYNKNTSEYYSERVKYDADYTEDLERKAFSIVFSDQPPEKKFSPSYYACKSYPCKYYDVCHKGFTDITKTCRTCIHVDVANEGRWVCEKKNKNLTYDEQLAGCGDYGSII